MTAKEYVKIHYPHATKERHVSGGRVKGAGKPYFLIRPNIHEMWIGSGDTESKAWVDAKERIKSRLEEIEKNVSNKGG